VGFVVPNVPLVQAFLPVVRFFPFLSNVPPVLLNHFILVLLLLEGRAGKAFAVLNKTVLLDVGKTWTENYFNVSWSSEG